MYCTNCGSEIPDTSMFCPKCGHSFSPWSSKAVEMQSAEPKKMAPNSVGGFICGLLGFLIDWFPIIGFVISLIGVILCGKGKAQARSNPQMYGNTGLINAGHVFAIIGLVFSSIVLLITLIWGVILGGGLFALFDILDLDILDF